MAPKGKPVPRLAWTLYALVTERPFADDRWLERWRLLKEELKLRVPQ